MNRSRRALLLLASILGIALPGIVAWPISRQFGTDFRLTYLALLLVAYAVVSALVALQRSRLAKRLKDLPAAKRARFAEMHPEFRYAAAETQGGLSARAAIRVGVL